MSNKVNLTYEQRETNIRRNRVADITLEDGWNRDNLTVILATYFSDHMERPENDKNDPDLGWGPWVMQKTNEALDRIVAHIKNEKLPLHEEIVRLRTALNHIAHPDTYGTKGEDPRQIARKALLIGFKL